MNNFLIPFDNNPVSTEVKTGTYTIPTGKYARVTVIDGGTVFEIDSVVAREPYNQSSSSTIVGTGLLFTNSTPFTLYGSMTITSNSDVSVYAVGNTAFTANFRLYNNASAPSSLEIKMNPGDFIRCDTATGGVARWNLNTEAAFDKTVFWAPTATDIEADRYIVELFNNIS